MTPTEDQAEDDARRVAWLVAGECGAKVESIIATALTAAYERGG